MKQASGIRDLLLVLVLSLAAAGAAHAANNSQFVSQSVPAVMAPGQTYAVSVTMKNTGTTTWTSATAYSLGTQNPQDSQTWVVGARVALPPGASVAPNANVTFSFNVTAPATPNTYNFQFRMVQDGVEWFGAFSTNVAVKVGLNDAAFVSQVVPTVMTAGQTYAVSVTMQNTGGSTWTTGTGYALGSQNPQDNFTWGGPRKSLPAGASVAPGANVSVSFNVTAPSTPGTHNFQWKMVRDGFEWFGALSANVVVKSGLDNAAFVSQVVPPTMATGVVYPVSVTIQNTGSTTWNPGTVSLGSQNPADNTIWGLNRVALPNSVAPGASVTFSFNVTSPATAGPYNFQWRMLEGTLSWFGATTQNAAMTVGTGSPLAGMHFIHVDYLNTPREIYDASSQLRWRWDQREPFGVNVPDENPSSLGTFEFPLRFPGQYFDKETNLAYNYFRDYDPAVGRYVQSDPIGLDGGLNTYGYVYGDPLAQTDPSGRMTAAAAGLISLAVIGTAVAIQSAQNAQKPGSGGTGLGGGSSGNSSSSSSPSNATATNCPGGDCAIRYAELIQEFWWIQQFEGLNVPYDPIQGLLIRQAKIEYNRHARTHNSRCPNKLPYFLVQNTRWIK